MGGFAATGIMDSSGTDASLLVVVPLVPGAPGLVVVPLTPAAGASDPCAEFDVDGPESAPPRVTFFSAPLNAPKSGEAT